MGGIRMKTSPFSGQFSELSPGRLCTRFKNGVTVNVEDGFNLGMTNTLAQVSLIDTRDVTIEGRLERLNNPMNLNVLPMFSQKTGRFALPDYVQVFGYIEPDDVAKFLYEASLYIFDKEN